MASEQLTKRAPNLKQAVDLFLLDGEARGLSPQTLRFYRQQLFPLVEFLRTESITELEQLTPSHLRRYLVSLQRRGLRDTSQHAAMRAARVWLNFCVREGLLMESPMSNVRMPKLAKRTLPALSPEDVRRLLAACDTERDRAALCFLVDTGLRAAEFCALNIGDVDLAARAVRVIAGKGGKDRTVFFGVKCHRALLRYLVHRDDQIPGRPLWVSLNTDERLTVWGLRLLLRRLGARADVVHCHPHTFRRTFALWSLRAGMDLVRLAALMGHSDLAMLRRYLALVEHDLQDAHRQHGAVDSNL